MDATEHTWPELLELSTKNTNMHAYDRNAAHLGNLGSSSNNNTYALTFLKCNYKYKRRSKCKCCKDNGYRSIVCANNRGYNNNNSNSNHELKQPACSSYIIYIILRLFIFIMSKSMRKPKVSTASDASDVDNNLIANQASDDKLSTRSCRLSITKSLACEQHAKKRPPQQPFQSYEHRCCLCRENKSNNSNKNSCLESNYFTHMSNAAATPTALTALTASVATTASTATSLTVVSRCRHQSHQSHQQHHHNQRQSQRQPSAHRRQEQQQPQQQQQHQLKALSMLLTLFIALALCVRGVSAGACWQTAFDNGKCKEIFSRNMTRAECCGISQELSYTDRELTSVEFFFATAIGEGIECAPCMETCRHVDCGPNKKCVKRKGRPKCICAPECGAAVRRKQQQLQRGDRLYRGHQHHNEQLHAPGLRRENIAVQAGVQEAEASLADVEGPWGKSPRDIRSLSSEITNINLGLDVDAASATAAQQLLQFQQHKQQHQQQPPQQRNHNQRKIIIMPSQSQQKPQFHRREQKPRRLLFDANVQHEEEKPTTRRLQIISNVRRGTALVDDASHSDAGVLSRHQQRRQHQHQHKSKNNSQNSNEFAPHRRRQQHDKTTTYNRHRKHHRHHSNDSNNNNNNNTNNYSKHAHISRIEQNTSNYTEREEEEEAEVMRKHHQHSQQQQQQHTHRHRKHQNHSKQKQKKLKDHQANSSDNNTNSNLFSYATATTAASAISELLTMPSAATTTTATAALQTATGTPANSPLSVTDHQQQQQIRSHGSSSIAASSSSAPATTLPTTSNMALLQPARASAAGRNVATSSSSSSTPVTARMLLDNIGAMQLAREYAAATTANSIAIAGNTLNADDFTLLDGIYDKYNQHGFPKQQQHPFTQYESAHHGSHPVCGTDGRTYNTECQLKKRACRTNNSNLQVAYRGHCKTSCNGVKCLNGLTCVEDHYTIPHCIACKADCPQEGEEEAGVAVGLDGSGIRAAAASRAVCGVDGKTYKSTCDINRMICKIGRSIAVAYPGPCRADRITCNEINCGPKYTCLVDLLTHEPRCVSCRYKCSRKRRPTSLRFEESKICGVNNHTYNSWCEMRKDSCSTGFFIDVKAPGECL